MPTALLEKLAFGVATVVLFALHRVVTPVLGLGLIDLALGVLFLIAYFATQESPSVGVSRQSDCNLTAILPMCNDSRSGTCPLTDSFSGSYFWGQAQVAALIS
jgi:hypothetical protein